MDLLSRLAELFRLLANSSKEEGGDVLSPIKTSNSFFMKSSLATP